MTVPALLALLLAGWAHAAEPAAPPARPWLSRDVAGLGVGVLLGEPAGLSLAWQPAEGRLRTSGAVAWSFGRPGPALHAEAGLEVLDAPLRALPDLHLRATLAAGPCLRIGDPPGDGDPSDADLGLRLPVAARLTHAGAPLELFAEIAPGVRVVPDTRLFVDVAIGARVYAPAAR
ncbi:MAG: hypothetical protein RLZZ299_79 [Pseudomonadota bacterium]|jgi:hypothetical protein